MNGVLRNTYKIRTLSRKFVRTAHFILSGFPYVSSYIFYSNYSIKTRVTYLLRYKKLKTLLHVLHVSVVVQLTTDKFYTTNFLFYTRFPNIQAQNLQNDKKLLSIIVVSFLFLLFYWYLPLYALCTFLSNNVLRVLSMLRIVDSGTASASIFRKPSHLPSSWNIFFA